MTRKATGILVAAVLLGATIAWKAAPYFSSTNNGKDAVQEFISTSKHNCHWAGFLDLFKLERTEVYVACSPAADFQKSFDNKDQFIGAVESQIVEPGISTLPKDPAVSFITIVEVTSKIVLCTEVVENKIRRSWMDSYENYCQAP